MLRHKRGSEGKEERRGGGGGGTGGEIGEECA